MTHLLFPYGKEKLAYDFDSAQLLGTLESSIHHYTPECSEVELVERALAAPIGSPRLCELARGKKNIVIIASDHTRPVPSKVIMPAMLSEIRSTNPDADITILIATGCHRGTTRDELVGKFGEEIVAREKIYVHDCDEREKLVNIGKLPSGGDCERNSIAYNADLLVAEGFIEPHFFAGFSGGRKSVLPGISGRSTVLANHCGEFIAHPCARTGILQGNPIHEDMLWAAKTAKLAFIVNVVLNAEKQVIYASAGDSEAAHKAGTDFLSSLCSVDAIEADVVITTNGGYPLDQNVYQSVKGMTAAEASVREGGVIIMLAKCNDGTGGDHFYRQMAEESDITQTMAKILERGRLQTLPDQSMTQILGRILMRSTVVYVSEMPDDIIEQMHMIPAHSIEQAMDIAKARLANPNPTVVAIPDGVSVMVKK
jgi:nickel-dependent lactate racemase